MAHVKHKHKRIFWLLSLLTTLFLFGGLVISLAQLRSLNTLRSNAQNVNPVNCSVTPLQQAISSEEQTLFDLINNYRAEKGRTAFVWSPSLVSAASWLSKDMLSSGVLSHTDSLGRNVQTRIIDCGYNFSVFAENIDSGTADAEAIFNSWKHSPTQNANLLSTQFTDVGIALSSGASATAQYWTMNFGIHSTPVTPSISLTVTPTTSTTPVKTPTPTPKKPVSSVAPSARPTPSPTPPPEYVPNPLDMQLLISAKVSGIGEGGNIHPAHQTREVLVSLFDTKNKIVKTGTGFLVYDGSDLFRGVIHFGTVENGIYYVKVASDYALSATIDPVFQNLDSSRLNILPYALLLQGDMNKDNIINIKDYNLALGCFQNTRCDDMEIIDFNKDTKTNIVDYNILLQNYWQSSGD